LKTLALYVLAAGVSVTVAMAANPHLDRSIVQSGCPACHESHGVSRSPMLPAPQTEVCLSCHGSKARADQQVSRGVMSPNANLQLLTPTLAQPFTHPISEDAYSRREPGVVTCTSCHTPHRSTTNFSQRLIPLGQQKLSTRNPTRPEFQLCESCHGDQGVDTQNLLDISHLINPNNSSFHPIESSAPGTSPSVVPRLAGQVINCTDCHGNSKQAGPRGPHGSDFRYILTLQYVTVDGDRESLSTYALCYGCHEREAVLETSPFPQHGMHIVGQRASCATCHNAHGSVDNRALVRFGEETIIGGVSPSVTTGLLRFESSGQGSGACYLTCHGVDHNPKTYGGEMGIIETLSGPQLQPFGLDVESVPGGQPQPGKKQRKHQERPPPRER